MRKMRIGKAAAVTGMIAMCFLAGCGKTEDAGSQDQEEKEETTAGESGEGGGLEIPAKEDDETGETADASATSPKWRVPSDYKDKVSDILSFDAEVIVSDTFQGGIFYKTKGRYQEYDGEAFQELFFADRKIRDRYTYEMPDRSGMEKEGYAWQSEDGGSLCLYPTEAIYSAGAETDYYFYGFCDITGNVTMYNADRYSLTEELDFMTREEAKQRVSEVLEGMGLSAGEAVFQAYALDAPTLCEESERVYEWGFAEGDVDFRTAWEKEHEAYAFQMWQMCQGLPVWTVNMDPLSVADESNAPVTGILREDGFVRFYVSDILDLKTEEEYDVLMPFEDIIGKIEEKYAVDAMMEKTVIREMRLCALTVRDSHGGCILTPVWICTGKLAEDDYPVQTAFDAVAGEEIANNL